MDADELVAKLARVVAERPERGRSGQREQPENAVAAHPFCEQAEHQRDSYEDVEHVVHGNRQKLHQPRSGLGKVPSARHPPTDAHRKDKHQQHADDDVSR